MNDFAPLTEHLEALASRLTPAERRAFGREVALGLRREAVPRIKANVTPDGDPMVPRKAKPKGRSKAKRMFQRATSPSRLRMKATADEAELGFVGAMNRIMSLHQSGGTDTVERRADAPVADYPARPVLGLTPETRTRILDALTKRLAP